MFYNHNLNEPFCRSVAEAITCGILIMTNSQSKFACFYDKKKYGIEKLKDNCKNASVDFWNKA